MISQKERESISNASRLMVLTRIEYSSFVIGGDYLCIVVLGVVYTY